MENRRKIKNEEAFRFMTAGKSIFTILNTKTNNRFTFKVVACKNPTNAKTSVHFVKVMTGRDNEKSYSFIGTMFNKEVFRYSTKSRLNAESQQVRAFDWYFSKLLANELPDFIETWHEGRCGRCGKTLTVPQSIELGFGPECISIMGGKDLFSNKILDSI